MGWCENIFNYQSAKFKLLSQAGTYRFLLFLAFILFLFIFDLFQKTLRIMAFLTPSPQKSLLLIQKTKVFLFAANVTIQK